MSIELSRKKPLVSVCMITYNHEAFIAEAIGSVLMQQRTFELEIVISDDFSTDGTASIIDAYHKKHPHIITFLRNESNIGMQRNFRQALLACEGTYIALLEGDDYYSDPLKLQKQVDFLEQNKEYAICYHRVKLLRDGVLKPDDINTLQVEHVYTILDLAKRNIMHTPSIVFRKNFADVPDWFVQSPAGDYPLHMLNARFGKIKYLPCEMAVYRMHQNSSWSSMSIIKRYTSWFKVLQLLIAEFSNEKVVKQLLLEQLSNEYNNFSRACRKIQDFETHNHVTRELLFGFPELWPQWYENYLKKYIDKRSIRVKKKFLDFLNALKGRFF